MEDTNSPLVQNGGFKVEISDEQSSQPEAVEDEEGALEDDSGSIDLQVKHFL
jgi:hypothetical protein